MDIETQSFLIYDQRPAKTDERESLQSHHSHRVLSPMSTKTKKGILGKENLPVILPHSDSKHKNVASPVSVKPHYDSIQLLKMSVLSALVYKIYSVETLLFLPLFFQTQVIVIDPFAF